MIGCNKGVILRLRKLFDVGILTEFSSASLNRHTLFSLGRLHGIDFFVLFP